MKHELIKPKKKKKQINNKMTDQVKSHYILTQPHV